MKKGKIIVIDGIDGSGKKTQTKLLADRLKKLKKKVVTIDFPQYDKNFFGNFLKDVLTTPEYEFLKIHPKIGSILYAADRWETKVRIEKYLNQGYIVVCDRYVSANQIHQGSKIDHNGKRKEFMKWLHTLEHEVFKIPKPNIILYLNIEWKTAQKLIQDRNQDVAEKDLRHQEAAQKSALKLVGELKNMKVVNCDDRNGGIRSREEISDLVFKQVKKYL